MFTIDARVVDAKAWRGYKINRMPAKVALLEPAAAASFKDMTLASMDCFEYTDIYRSVLFQAECIIKKPGKRKLYAPPSKSGHNFCWSFDLAIKETLDSLKKSGNQELIEAGKSRDSLAEWMKQFGWSGISTEPWHFNYLAGHKSTVEKIRMLYSDRFVLSNEHAQTALNRLLKTNLVVDGIIGRQTHRAIKMAESRLAIFEGNGTITPWLMRVLACATAELRISNA